MKIDTVLLLIDQAAAGADNLSNPNIIIAAIGLIITGLTLAFTIYQFTQTKKREERTLRETSLREYRSSFFEERMMIYREVSHCVSVLANSAPDSLEFDESTYQFNYLFYGKMCLVESSDVERVMVKVRELLGIIKGNESNQFSTRLMALLKNFSLTLAHTLRNSNIQMWDLAKDEFLESDFGDYSERYKEFVNELEAIKLVIDEVKNS